MKERPILFNTPMVRAILDDCKTKSRRLVKGIALQWLNEGFTPEFVADKGNGLSPYGYVGDRLWVREAHFFTRYDCDALQLRDHVRYAADGTYCPGRDCVGRSWRPSIHMPRWASRITLEIAGLKVERLKDISDDDVAAEGIKWQSTVDDSIGDYIATSPRPKDSFPPKLCFVRTLGQASKVDPQKLYDDNPWVWAYTFRRIDA